MPRSLLPHRMFRTSFAESDMLLGCHGGSNTISTLAELISSIASILCLTSAGSDCAAGQFGRRQSHLDVRLLLIDLDVVDQSQLVDIDRDFRVVTGLDDLDDLFLNLGVFPGTLRHGPSGRWRCGAASRWIQRSAGDGAFRSLWIRRSRPLLERGVRARRRLARLRLVRGSPTSRLEGAPADLPIQPVIDCQRLFVPMCYSVILGNVARAGPFRSSTVNLSNSQRKTSLTPSWLSARRAAHSSTCARPAWRT